MKQRGGKDEKSEKGKKKPKSFPGRARVFSKTIYEWHRKKSKVVTKKKKKKLRIINLSRMVFF